jgi:predicted DNA-binding protein
VYTTKKIQIKNLSKTKVKYIIEVPEKYIDEVHFEPSEKELNAN